MARLILVDADRNFGRSLAIALRLDGVPVTAAESVDAALADLEAGEFAVCVVDCLVPGAEDLFARADEGAIRVVATASHAEILDGAARRHPRLSTLRKPFRPVDLEAHLRSAVAGVP